MHFIWSTDGEVNLARMSRQTSTYFFFFFVFQRTWDQWERPEHISNTLFDSFMILSLCLFGRTWKWSMFHILKTLINRNSFIKKANRNETHRVVSLSLWTDHYSPCCKQWKSFNKKCFQSSSQWRDCQCMLVLLIFQRSLSSKRKSVARQ